MTKKILFLLLVLVTVIACATAVGCGSDGEPADSTTNASSSEPITVATSSLSKAEYIKQAEGVCRRVRHQMGKEVEAYGRELGKPQPEDATVEATKDSILIPGVKVHIEEIGELGAPQGEKAQVEALLAAMQKGVEIAESTRVTRFRAFGNLFRQYDILARKYGLAGCTFD